MTTYLSLFDVNIKKSIDDIPKENCKQQCRITEAEFLMEVCPDLQMILVIYLHSHHVLGLGTSAYPFEKYLRIWIFGI